MMWLWILIGYLVVGVATAIYRYATYMASDGFDMRMIALVWPICLVGIGLEIVGDWFRDRGKP